MNLGAADRCLPEFALGSGRIEVSACKNYVLRTHDRGALRGPPELSMGSFAIVNFSFSISSAWDFASFSAAAEPLIRRRSEPKQIPMRLLAAHTAGAAICTTGSGQLRDMPRLTESLALLSEGTN